MIVSIMLNYVATLFMGYVYTTLLRDGSVPQTVAVADSMKIAGISKGFPAHWGVLAAFLLAAVLYYFIFYTSKGFKLRAVGMNATAAFSMVFPLINTSATLDTASKCNSICLPSIDSGNSIH